MSWQYEQLQGSTERLGQYFCNRYVKSSWPKLFYEEDFNKCSILIEKWLKKYCYETQIPPQLTDTV